MDPKNRRALKQAARNALGQASYDPKKLVLIHTGAAVALSVLVTLINYLLSLRIDQATGLGGMDTRTMLTTMQSLLTNSSNVLMPFWNAGFIFTTLCITAGAALSPNSLLEGFRRFGPMVRYFLLYALLLLGVGFLSFMLSTQLFLLTPLSNAFLEVMETIQPESILSGSQIVLDPATEAMILDSYMPLLVLFIIFFVGALAFVTYHYRLALYILFDHPGTGVFAAMRASRMQMHGHKRQLLVLDLSFWWYYVLQSLALFIVYIPYLLALFGVELPFSYTLASFLFLGLSLLAQLALSYFAKYRVEVTYTLFYRATTPQSFVQ